MVNTLGMPSIVQSSFSVVNWTLQNLRKSDTKKR